MHAFNDCNMYICTYLFIFIYFNGIMGPAERAHVEHTKIYLTHIFLNIKLFNA